jgi:hypothetical protein
MSFELDGASDLALKDIVALQQRWRERVLDWVGEGRWPEGVSDRRFIQRWHNELGASYDAFRILQSLAGAVVYEVPYSDCMRRLRGSLGIMPIVEYGACKDCHLLARDDSWLATLTIDPARTGPFVLFFDEVRPGGSRPEPAS